MKHLIPGTEIENGIFVGILVNNDGPYMLVVDKKDSDVSSWNDAMKKYKAAVPTIEELNMMRANYKFLNMNNGWYWSSTEYNNYSSWVQRFNDGNQNSNGKFNNYRVRCVRRISFDSLPVQKDSKALKELKKQTALLEKIAGVLK